MSVYFLSYLCMFQPVVLAGASHHYQLVNVMCLLDIFLQCIVKAIGVVDGDGVSVSPIWSHDTRGVYALWSLIIYAIIGIQTAANWFPPYVLFISYYISDLVDVCSSLADVAKKCHLHNYPRLLHTLMVWCGLVSMHL